MYWRLRWPPFGPAGSRLGPATTATTGLLGRIRLAPTSCAATTAVSACARRTRGLWRSPSRRASSRLTGVVAPSGTAESPGENASPRIPEATSPTSDTNGLHDRERRQRLGPRRRTKTHSAARAARERDRRQGTSPGTRAFREGDSSRRASPSREEPRPARSTPGSDRKSRVRRSRTPGPLWTPGGTSLQESAPTPTRQYPCPWETAWAAPQGGNFFNGGAARCSLCHRSLPNWEGNSHHGRQFATASGLLTRQQGRRDQIASIGGEAHPWAGLGAVGPGCRPGQPRPDASGAAPSGTI